jgi:hypothetical protein
VAAGEPSVALGLLTSSFSRYRKIPSLPAKTGDALQVKRSSADQEQTHTRLPPYQTQQGEITGV